MAELIIASIVVVCLLACVLGVVALAREGVSSSGGRIRNPALAISHQGRRRSFQQRAVTDVDQARHPQLQALRRGRDRAPAARWSSSVPTTRGRPRRCRRWRCGTSALKRWNEKRAGKSTPEKPPGRDRQPARPRGDSRSERQPAVAGSACAGRADASTAGPRTGNVRIDLVRRRRDPRPVLDVRDRVRLRERGVVLLPPVAAVRRRQGGPHAGAGRGGARPHRLPAPDVGARRHRDAPGSGRGERPYRRGPDSRRAAEPLLPDCRRGAGALGRVGSTTSRGCSGPSSTRRATSPSAAKWR